MSTVERWFALLRKVVLFGLGVAIVIEAISVPFNPVTEYIVGAIFLGLVSVEEIVIGKRNGGNSP